MPEEKRDYEHFKTDIMYFDECEDPKNNPGLPVSKSYLFVTPDIETYHWINHLTYAAIEVSNMNVLFIAAEDDPDNFRMSYNRWYYGKFSRQDKFREYMKEDKLAIVNLVKGGGQEITRTRSRKIRENFISIENIYNLSALMYHVTNMALNKLPVLIETDKENPPIRYGPLILIKTLSAVINAIGFERAYKFMFRLLSKIVWSPGSRTILMTFINRKSVSDEELAKLGQLFDGLFQIEKRELYGISRLFFKIEVISELEYFTPWIPYLYFDRPASIVFLEPRVLTTMLKDKKIVIKE